MDLNDLKQMKISELYKLAKDLRESKDLSSSNPELAAAIESELIIILKIK